MRTLIEVCRRLDPRCRHDAGLVFVRALRLGFDVRRCLACRRELVVEVVRDERARR
jgi:hypothetical protein